MVVVPSVCGMERQRIKERSAPRCRGGPSGPLCLSLVPVPGHALVTLWVWYPRMIYVDSFSLLATAVRVVAPAIFFANLSVLDHGLELPDVDGFLYIPRSPILLAGEYGDWGRVGGWWC